MLRLGFQLMGGVKPLQPSLAIKVEQIRVSEYTIMFGNRILTCTTFVANAGPKSIV